MKLVHAKSAPALLHDDGALHYPFSKYLAFRSTNPHTQELTAQSLRVFYRFLNANKIELVVRALEGFCMTLTEVQSLAALCYRPLSEVELLSDKKVALISSAKAEKLPKDLRGAVEPNTARLRLLDVAGYLNFYWQHFLESKILSQPLRNALKEEYQKTCDLLKAQIRGTKQNHHLKLQSLPSAKFLEVIRALVVRRDQLFVNASGQPVRTLQRDTVMALLACEGLRPGAIGNCVLQDFRPNSGHLAIKDNRERRGRQKTTYPVLKLGDTTNVNSGSETMIELWPWTVAAITEYIEGERAEVLSKHLSNLSKGFLFLSERGGPICHRASISNMFNRLGKRLALLGLLDVDDDPYFFEQERYDFYAYVLRHSSASFYLARKGESKNATDTMKHRYGWTRESTMPELYAARALSDQANINLADFHQQLLAEAAEARKRNERPQL